MCYKNNGTKQYLHGISTATTHNKDSHVSHTQMHFEKLKTTEIAVPTNYVKQSDVLCRGQPLRGQSRLH